MKEEEKYRCCVLYCIVLCVVMSLCCRWKKEITEIRIRNNFNLSLSLSLLEKI